MNTENKIIDFDTYFSELAGTRTKIFKKKMILQIAKFIGFVLITLLYLSATILFAIKTLIAEAILFGITFVIWLIVTLINIPLVITSIKMYNFSKIVLTNR